MTGLLIAVGLALIVLAGILIWSRQSAVRLAPLATALMLGLAGYAWQGSPGLAGKPVKAGSGQAKFDERLAAKRRDIGERISSATKWLVMSDAFGRQGNSQDAANVLLSGIKENPRDANLWVGMGNALVVHGNGRLSPAATYAFRQALTLQPNGIAPSYFYGLALAESGDFERSKAVWIDLARRLPADAELRDELIRNIVLLNSLIKRQETAGQGGNPAP